MAIDLNLLKAGDDAEWETAWRELHLWHLAKSVVYRTMGAGFPQHVEDVTADALSELVLKAIKRCRSIKRLIPLLLKIAWERAVDFLRSAWGQNVTASTDKRPEERDKVAPTVFDREALLRFLEADADGLRLEPNEMEPFLHLLVEKTKLNTMQEALLRELLVGGLSQQEFADGHRLNVKTIGRRKADVLKKLGRFLRRTGILEKWTKNRRR